MTDNNIQQFILDKIDYAQYASNIKFCFLKSWTEYQDFKNKRKVLKIILKVLRKSAQLLFKEYCKSVISQISDFNKLLAYHQLLIAIEFYEKELSVILDIIYEYEAYLMNSNFLYALFGGVRSPEDMRDFREEDYYGP